MAEQEMEPLCLGFSDSDKFLLVLFYGLWWMYDMQTESTQCMCSG